MEEARHQLEPQVGKIRDEVLHLQQEAAVKGRLVDLKQLKKERDANCAMRVAAARDRFFWMLGFYGMMGALTAARMYRLRALSPLPLEYLPFALVPTLILNTADMAYGSKFQRIHRDAQRVLHSEDGWWFNEPLPLPPLLEPHYGSLQHDTNSRLAALGYPPEPDWACFPSQPSSDPPLRPTVNKSTRKKERKKERTEK